MPTPSELTKQARTALDRVTTRARHLPELRNEFIVERRHNALLRDVGELHYDAHRDGTPVDPADADDIFAELDDLHAAETR